jgi:hypothetical protein
MRTEPELVKRVRYEEFEAKVEEARKAYEAKPRLIPVAAIPAQPAIPGVRPAIPAVPPGYKKYYVPANIITQVEYLPPKPEEVKAGVTEVAKKVIQTADVGICLYWLLSVLL